MKASKATGAHARRMPDLHPPEASPRSQLSALDAQLADRDTYLKLAENLEGFLARPRTSAQAASTEERLRVLRLRAKDVLIGPERLPPAPHPRSGTPALPATITSPSATRRVTIAQVIHCVEAG